jgi:hypothetical protein
MGHPSIGRMFAWKHHGLWSVAESMVGGAQEHIPTEDGCSVMEAKLWPSTKLANNAVLTHRSDYLRLDKAFVLIEGHPSK